MLNPWHFNVDWKCIVNVVQFLHGKAQWYLVSMYLKGPFIHPSSTAFPLSGVTEGGDYPSCLGAAGRAPPGQKGQLIAALKHRHRRPFTLTLSRKVKGQVKVTNSPTPQMHVCGLCEEVGGPRENPGNPGRTGAHTEKPPGSVNPEPSGWVATVLTTAPACRHVCSLLK